MLQLRLRKVLLFIVLVQCSEKGRQRVDILSGQPDAGEFSISIAEKSRALKIRRRSIEGDDLLQCIELTGVHVGS